MKNDRRPLDEVLREGAPKAPAIGERVLWDDVVRGLGLRLRAGSPSTWIYRWRIDGRWVKQTLGPGEAMRLDEARAAAEAVARSGVADKTTVTLQAFAATFLHDCAGRWKPSTLCGHRHDLNTHIIPILGAKPIHQVSHVDVSLWLEQMQVSGRSKDRALSVFSSMMRHAETLGLRPVDSNPCAGRRRHRSDFVARYLEGEDFRRLGRALDQAAKFDPVEVACIRFLMLTGARRGEALALEWNMIEDGRAVLPDSKTGAKCLWLATPVRRVLAGLVRVETSPRVFTRTDGRGIISSLDRVWRAVRKRAGLDGLRLHDLRHSYASIAVGSGEGLRTVAGLLGHSQMVTTMGYAHLAEAPVMAAAERVTDHLAGALEPCPPVEPIRPKSWAPKASRKGPSPAYLAAKARMAAFHASIDPAGEIKTERCEPKPALLSPQELSEEERRWLPHIQAFRKSKLKLPDFCRREEFDPAAMRKALASHFKRVKGRMAEQGR